MLVGLKSVAGGLKGFFRLEFLGVLLLDCPLDVFHLIVAVLITVLLHGNALFLFDGARPDFHIIDFLVLEHFKGLSLPTQNILVESHYLIVIQVFLPLLEHFDSVIANFFYVALQKFIKDFSSTLLPRLIQLVHQCISDPLLFILDFLSVEFFFFLDLLKLNLFCQRVHLLL